MSVVNLKASSIDFSALPVHPIISPYFSSSPSKTQRSPYFSVNDSDDSEPPDISDIPLNFINAYLCRPRLIQGTLGAEPMDLPMTLFTEELSDSPWKLLIATLLLNKTTGKRAVPVFRQLMAIWPTPKEMASAPILLLKSLVQDLGFGNSRPRWIIELSAKYVSSPPSPRVFYRSRAKDFVSNDYPPTMVSHLPHIGKYALDSYRIFCCGSNEWRNVRPSDKELVKYLKWKWAFKHLQEWDPEVGIVGPLSNDRFADLCAGRW